MKKIGIITMHTPINYGSYLQTFALSKTIKELGYDVEIINYRYPTEYHRNHQQCPNTKIRKNTKEFLKEVIIFLCNFIVKSSDTKLQKKLDEFYDKYIKLTKPYLSYEELENDPPAYDIYITGSDQVWNPQNVGYDKAYLLSWVKSKTKKIAYSASFGLKELPEEYHDLYRNELLKYDYISTRETSPIIPQLLGKNNIVVVDPTFLLDREKWLLLAGNKPIIKGKYILCYILSYRYNPYPYIYSLINHLKKETGFKVVFLDNDPIRIIHGYHLANNTSPLEFVNLFMHSSLVITTSFHGTAFAINANKPFLTVVDSGANDNRQLSLIRDLGINSSCVIEKGADPQKVIIPEFDYLTINEKLNSKRELSINFLKEALV